MIHISEKLLARNMVVHWSDKESCLCSKDLWLYRYYYDSENMVKLCRLPRKHTGIRGFISDYIARSWLKQKLKPSPGIGHVTQITEDKVLVIHDRIYLCEPKNTKMNVRFIEPSFRFANPLRGGIACHAGSKKVYFGEYLNGHTRDIRIYAIDTDYLTIKECWAFSRSDIKHIHAIHYDIYRDRIWVLTGDTDQESAFYYTDDEFITLHKFGSGSQQWRAISMLITPDAIEWGMDAGQDATADDLNYLFKYTFSTGQVTRHELVGNPVYAATKCGQDNAIVATTFEPARKQPTIASAELWWQSKNKDWFSLIRFNYKKSRIKGVGNYCMVYLPYGELPNNTIVCTPINSASYDYCCVLYKVHN